MSPNRQVPRACPPQLKRIGRLLALSTLWHSARPPPPVLRPLDGWTHVEWVTGGGSQYAGGRRSGGLPRPLGIFRSG